MQRAHGLVDLVGLAGAEFQRHRAHRAFAQQDGVGNVRAGRGGGGCQGLRLWPAGERLGVHRLRGPSRWRRGCRNRRVVGFGAGFLLRQRLLDGGAQAGEVLAGGRPDGDGQEGLTGVGFHQHGRQTGRGYLQRDQAEPALAEGIGAGGAGEGLPERALRIGQGRLNPGGDGCGSGQHRALLRDPARVCRHGRAPMARRIEPADVTACPRASSEILRGAGPPRSSRSRRHRPRASAPGSRVRTTRAALAGRRRRAWSV